MKTEQEKLMSDANWIRAQLEKGKNETTFFRSKREWNSLSLQKKIRFLGDILSINQDTQSAAGYLAWFIENYPESPLLQELPRVVWSAESKKLIESAWNKVIQKGLSAASVKNFLITCAGSEKSWIQTTIGSSRDDLSFELSKSLIAHYETSKAETAKAALLVGQCVLSSKLPACGEKFGLLKQAIPICIQNDDLITAELLIKQLLETSKHCHMDLWKGYALIFSARVALKQKLPHRRILARLKENLLKLRKEIRMPLHLGATQEMVELFHDLQNANFKDDLLYLLEVCISTAAPNQKRALRKSIKEIEMHRVSSFLQPKSQNGI